MIPSLLRCVATIVILVVVPFNVQAQSCGGVDQPPCPQPRVGYVQSSDQAPPQQADDPAKGVYVAEETSSIEPEIADRVVPCACPPPPASCACPVRSLRLRRKRGELFRVDHADKPAAPFVGGVNAPWLPSEATSDGIVSAPAGSSTEPVRRKRRSDHKKLVVFNVTGNGTASAAVSEVDLANQAALISQNKELTEQLKQAQGSLQRVESKLSHERSKHVDQLEKLKAEQAKREADQLKKDKEQEVGFNKQMDDLRASFQAQSLALTTENQKVLDKIRGSHKARVLRLKEQFEATVAKQKVTESQREAYWNDKLKADQAALTKKLDGLKAHYEQRLALAKEAAEKIAKSAAEAAANQAARATPGAEAVKQAAALAAAQKAAEAARNRAIAQAEAELKMAEAEKRDSLIEQLENERQEAKREKDRFMRAQQATLARERARLNRSLANLRLVTARQIKKANAALSRQRRWFDRKYTRAQAKFSAQKVAWLKSRKRRQTIRKKKWLKYQARVKRERLRRSRMRAMKWSVYQKQQVAAARKREAVRAAKMAAVRKEWLDQLNKERLFRIKTVNDLQKKFQINLAQARKLYAAQTAQATTRAAQQVKAAKQAQASVTARLTHFFRHRFHTLNAYIRKLQARVQKGSRKWRKKFLRWMAEKKAQYRARASRLHTMAKGKVAALQNWEAKAAQAKAEHPDLDGDASSSKRAKVRQVFLHRKIRQARLLIVRMHHFITRLRAAFQAHVRSAFIKAKAYQRAWQNRERAFQAWKQKVLLALQSSQNRVKKLVNKIKRHRRRHGRRNRRNRRKAAAGKDKQQQGVQPQQQGDQQRQSALVQHLRSTIAYLKSRKAKMGEVMKSSNNWHKRFWQNRASWWNGQNAKYLRRRAKWMAYFRKRGSKLHKLKVGSLGLKFKVKRSNRLTRIQRRLRKLARVIRWLTRLYVAVRLRARRTPAPAKARYVQASNNVRARLNAARAQFKILTSQYRVLKHMRQVQLLRMYKAVRFLKLRVRQIRLRLRSLSGAARRAAWLQIKKIRYALGRLRRGIKAARRRASSRASKRQRVQRLRRLAVLISIRIRRLVRTKMSGMRAQRRQRVLVFLRARLNQIRLGLKRVKKVSTCRKARKVVRKARRRLRQVLSRLAKERRRLHKVGLIHKSAVGTVKQVLADRVGDVRDRIAVLVLKAKRLSGVVRLVKGRLPRCFKSARRLPLRRSRRHSARRHSARRHPSRRHSARRHPSRRHSARRHSARRHSARRHSARRRPSRRRPSRKPKRRFTRLQRLNAGLNRLRRRLARALKKFYSIRGKTGPAYRKRRMRLAKSVQRLKLSIARVQNRIKRSMARLCRRFRSRLARSKARVARVQGRLARLARRLGERRYQNKRRRARLMARINRLRKRIAKMLRKITWLRRKVQSQMCTAVPWNVPGVPRSKGWQSIRKFYVPKLNRLLTGARKLSSPSGAYTVTFFIRPTGTRSGWGSIISRTNHRQEGYRPGLFFRPSSTSLVAFGSSVSKKNFKVEGGQLPLRRWSHVTVTHCPNGRFSLFVNGKTSGSEEAGAPLNINGPFYGGDPWHRAGVKGVVMQSRFLDRCISARAASLLHSQYQANLKKWKAILAKRMLAPKWHRLSLFHKVKVNKRLSTGANLGYTKGRGYAVSLWVRSGGPVAGWGSILARGDSYHDGRHPGLWFAPNSLKLVAAVSSVSNWNHHVYGPTLTQRKWHHVVVSHCANGQFTLFVNGKAVAQQTTAAPVTSKGSFWSGDPWHGASKAHVFDARYLSVCTSPTRVQRLFHHTRTTLAMYMKRFKRIGRWVTIKDRYVPRQNRPIRNGSIKKFGYMMGKGYSISLWVKPMSAVGPWSSVLARTAHSGQYHNGRQPGIFLYPGSTRIGVASSTTTNWNEWLGGPELKKRVWSHVVVSHCPNGRLTLFVDGTVRTRVQGQPPVSTGGKFWGSDPWHTAARVKVSRAQYLNRCVGAQRVKRMYRRHFTGRARLLRLLAARYRALQWRTRWRNVKKAYIPKRDTVIHSPKGLGYIKKRGYALSLWVKAKGVVSSWGGLISRGPRNYHQNRQPGLWFQPNTLKLMASSSSTINWDVPVHAQAPLRANKWYHVVINHCGNGDLNLFVNGKKQGKTVRGHIPLAQGGPVWGSDPHHPAANAVVASVKYLPICAPPNRIRRMFRKTIAKRAPWRLINWLYKPSKNRQLNDGKKMGYTLGKGYAISLWVKPKGTVNSWSNILARGGNYHHGRAPGFFFYPNSLKVGVASSALGNWNPWLAGPTLPPKQWTHLVVSHCSKGRMTFFVNGRQVGALTGLVPVAEGGPFWGSDPWHASANAVVHNARYMSICVSGSTVRRVFSKQQRAIRRFERRREREREARKRKHQEWKKKYPWKKVAWVFKPRQGRQLADGSKLNYVAGRGYAFAFWVKPKEKIAHWANLIHRGLSDRQRSPSIFFAPGTTQLVAVSSTNNDWNTMLKSPNELPIDKWTHVSLSHCAGGRLALYLNGQKVAQQHNLIPASNMGPLWGSSPHWKGAAAVVFDLRYLPVCAASNRVQSIYGHTRNRLPAGDQDVFGWEGPSTITCKAFWEASGHGCPASTHLQEVAQEGTKCHVLRNDCVQRCCAPKTITCATHYEVNSCPAGWIAKNNNEQSCQVTADGANSCDRQCCSYVQPGKGKCGYWGDPHLISFDDNRYDCLTPGEYKLYASNKNDEEVHSEQVKMPGQAYVHVPPLQVGVAFKDQQNVFSVYEEPPQWSHLVVTLRYNGQLIPYPEKPTKFGNFFVVPNGGELAPVRADYEHQGFKHTSLSVTNMRTRTSVDVHFRQTSYSFRFLDVFVSQGNETRRGEASEGLCGSWDGNSANDLVDSQGKTCTAAGANSCCLSWRVSSKQSLFRRPETSINMKGICMPAESCPSGWSDVGVARVILHNKDAMVNPFAKSNDFNGGYQWRMPRLCCARYENARLQGLYVTQKECGEGTDDKGLGGEIMVNSMYQSQPFSEGGMFNAGWRWTHPKLCKVRSHSRVVGTPKVFCGWGQHGRCPAGWQDHGAVGVTIPKGQVSTTPFVAGGGFSKRFVWAHPKLCCTRGGRNYNRFGWGVYIKRFKKDIGGSDVGQVTGTAHQCAKICLQRSDCAAFTRSSAFGDYQVANCHLKKIKETTADTTHYNTYIVEKDLTPEQTCSSSARYQAAINNCKALAQGSMYEACLTEFCAGDSVKSIKNELAEVTRGYIE